MLNRWTRWYAAAVHVEHLALLTGKEHEISRRRKRPAWIVQVPIEGKPFGMSQPEHHRPPLQQSHDSRVAYEAAA